jgi:predicted GIY-YIG superfamily endonuclease
MSADFTPKGWVYVLRLEDKCWYVGYSAEPQTRIASHFLGRGAQWTRVHAPLAVESLQPGDEHLEDVMTIALMAKHGFQLVRGGKYLQVNMVVPPPPILKAFSINPPAPVPLETEGEAVHGHSVLVTHLRDEGLRSWRARVCGDRALKCCPTRGYKTIYAASEQQLKELVRKWLEQD